MLLITRRSNIAKKEKIKQTTMRQITLKSDERNEAPPSSPLICPPAHYPLISVSARSDHERIKFTFEKFDAPLSHHIIPHYWSNSLTPHMLKNRYHVLQEYHALVSLVVCTSATSFQIPNLYMWKNNILNILLWAQSIIMWNIISVTDVIWCRYEWINWPYFAL